MVTLLVEKSCLFSIFQLCARETSNKANCFHCLILLVQKNPMSCALWSTTKTTGVGYGLYETRILENLYFANLDSRQEKISPGAEVVWVPDNLNLTLAFYYRHVGAGRGMKCFFV